MVLKQIRLIMVVEIRIMVNMGGVLIETGIVWETASLGMMKM